MKTRESPSIPGPLIAAALILTIALSLTHSNASASVMLADAPAERAQTVSGAAPVLTQPSDMTVGIGETADQALNATDSDGDPVTFSKTAGPAFMTVTTTDAGSGTATGNIHLAPGDSDMGVTQATVMASDGTLSVFKDFQIRVQGPPSAPVLAQPSDMTLYEGDTQTQVLTATDSNGDPLEFYLASGPSYVAVTTFAPGTGNATGELAASPGYNVSGTQQAVVGVTDGTLIDERSLSITILRSDVPPILNQPGAMYVRVGEVEDQALSAYDANGDPVTFTKLAGPPYMTVTTVDASAGSGNVRLAPGSGDIGSTTGQIRASDGALFDQKSFSITVTPNTAPYIYSLYSMYLPANTIQNQVLYAYDNDGDILTFTKSVGPTYMTVTTTSQSPGNANGNLRVAPLAGDVGNAFGTVRVSDGMLFAEASLNITVIAPNQPPTLVQPGDMLLNAGEVGTQTVSATDPDGDYISISKVSGPAYVTASGFGYGTATGTVTAAPGSSDTGTATVSIRASDSFGSDTKSFSVTVQVANYPAPCPPEAYAGSTLFVGYGLIEVQAADLNDDRAIDLVAELSGEGRVAILLGAGDGSFPTDPTSLDTGATPVSGVIADFNGDEIPDLAIANYGSSSVSVFLGDGAGGFGPKHDFPCGGEQRSIAAGDLNRDGKTDLVVTRTYTNSIAVLRGNGNGTFTAATVIQAGTYPWSLQLSDLNRDGALDVVVVNVGDNDISVFLNNGTGGLGSRTDYSVGTEPYGISVADFNGDGKPDVAVSCGAVDFISVLPGNGDGTLGARRNFGTHDRPSLIAVADMNGDGYPDLATANYYSGDASILLGDGNGGFGPRTNVPVGSGSYGIAAGDFDDDLRTDLVVTSYNSGSLSLLMNGCAPRPDHPPVVQVPKLLTTGEGVPVTLTVTANDPDGPSITSLTASFAGLPLGHNATFTADPANTSGSFAWTPGYQDARPTAYTVTFTAANVLSGSAATKIRVNNTNRAPVANAGGPYSAFAGSPLTFNGTSSADPDGDVLTFNWVYGDGFAGTGSTPVHTYVAVGVYGIALTVSDGPLYGVATTTATIVGMLQARAFTASGNRNIRLNAGKPQWCANIEPVGQSYANMEVDLTTLVLKSPGTGSVEQIQAIQDKVSTTGDRDGNGVDEIAACFSKDDLRLLFSNLHGTTLVTVTMEGSLFAGGIFRAQMDLNVQASGGGQLAATVSPNPLNPEAVLTFYTDKQGSARVDLFDLRGRLVRRLVEEQALAPGYHDVRIDGYNDHGEKLASGMYFFRVRADGEETAGRITILK